MRNQLQILLLFALFTACTSTDTDREGEIKTEKKKEIISDDHTRVGVQFVLDGDSGFVLKQEGVHFLKEISKPNTLEMIQVKESDVIGKYYKNGKGNYLVCFSRQLKNAEFGDYLFVELTAEGNLVKQEKFTHSPFPSCWDNKPLDGFHKYGDFFEFRHCQMADEYNSSNLYIFKELTSQLNTSNILDYSWSLRDNIQVQSTKEYRKDTLIVHYQVDSLYVETIDEEQMLDSVHVTKIREETILFEYKGGKLITKDVFKLQELEIKTLQ